jgi:rhodanese-related sulfurtransferase
MDASMHKRKPQFVEKSVFCWTMKYLYLVFLSGLLLPFVQTHAEDKEFPERARYYMVKWISTDDLYKQLKNVEIVDVRSKYEYETLHITGARNIILGAPSFVNDVINLRNTSKKPLVFYCNGQTCKKSYEATIAAQNAGITDVLAFDAGILKWAKQYPEQSLLLGKPLKSSAELIDDNKYQAHILSRLDFEKKIKEGNALVLDVRDSFQTDGLALYPLIQRSVPLDNKQLQRYVDQAKRENKTLLIFDATGHQAPWLQYYLEAQNVPSYYFMEGGAKGYYDELVAKSKK